MGERTVLAAKRQLRRQLLAKRAERSTLDRRTAAETLCTRLFTLPELASVSRVAGYVSTSAEPGTGPLLAALTERGCRVLLPVLEADFDLSWAVYQPGALREARFGIREPTGDALGLDAVGQASVVICPALAADARGHRLGRGGGSYDRVLARLGPSTLRVALVYDDEILATVPVDDHDLPVDVVVTPTRVVRAPPFGV